MLDSFNKHKGPRGWLSAGKRDLLSRSSKALTHFIPDHNRSDERESAPDARPHWSLLPGEIEETAKDLIVRVEAPGMNSEDCRITVDGNTLYLSGRKRCVREAGDSTYHIRERAYGAFQRSISLPRNVDTDRAQTSFRDGVITIRLPKARNYRPWLIPVT